MHSCPLLFDHFQFTLIHRPNILGFYAILFFTALDFISPPDTSATGRCFCFGSASSFLLELFLHYSPVAYWTPNYLGFPGCATDKEPTCQCRRHETWVWSLGQENPLQQEMGTHSSILAWRIPWIEEPGGLQFIRLHRVRHNWSNLSWRSQLNI